ncbi:MAG: Ig-like domain-containing protein [Myxococcota bacterium]
MSTKLGRRAFPVLGILMATFPFVVLPAMASTLANGSFIVEIDDRSGSISNVHYAGVEFYPEDKRISDYAMEVVARGNRAALVQGDGLFVSQELVVRAVNSSGGVVTVSGDYRPPSGDRVKFRRRYSIDPDTSVLRVDLEFFNRSQRTIDLRFAEVFNPDFRHPLARWNDSRNDIVEIPRGLRGAYAWSQTIYGVMMTSRDPRAALGAGVISRISPFAPIGLLSFADPNLSVEDRNLIVGGDARLVPGESTSFSYFQSYAPSHLLAGYALANAIFGPCHVVDAVDDTFVVVEQPASRPVLLPVLANEECANDHPLTLVAGAGLMLPDRGGFAFTPDGVHVAYYYPDGFLGTETFRYAVRDARRATSNGIPIAADEDTAMVTVSVVADEQPVARPDRASIRGWHPISIDVLRNDDLGNTPVRVATSRLPQLGRAIVIDETTIRYEPRDALVREDSFTYRMLDVDGDFAEAEVRLERGFDPLALPMSFGGVGTQPRSVVIWSVPSRFDAVGLIDPESIRIGSARVLGRVELEEPNPNEMADERIGFRFLIEDTGLPCDATSARLEGMTFDGQPISGFAPIQPRGC